MKPHLLRHLPFLALVPLLSGGCAAAVAGVAAGYIITNEVLPNNIHIAQVAFDVDEVWPSVKETMTFYQAPGTELVVVDTSPRSIKAEVDGADVLVEVEALDLDSTSIRVTASKYLGKDETTANEVMNGILKHLKHLDKSDKAK